jgi:thienamycin biosynthesis protein ThnN
MRSASVSPEIRRTSSSVRTYDELQRHLLRILKVHFDPEMGSPYWLQRQQELGIDVLQEINTIDDLYKLGPMDDESLRGLSVEEFMPRILHSQKHRLVLGDSAGSTGAPKVTAYAEGDYIEAFVEPFVNAAKVTGFPVRENWLFVGPSGPHIIGKAARACASRMESMDPFMVDFDPRWVKKMKPGSMGRQRYLDHVVEQALALIRTQSIGVLFTTPSVLEALAEHMTEAQRARVRGIHYGGIALTRRNYEDYRIRLFPNAVHLSGYGNTLFGMCPELMCTEPRSIDYYPHGLRVVIRLIPLRSGATPDPERIGEQVKYGERGQIMFHRLDPSGLIINMCERDSAERISPPADFERLGFVQDGFRHPEPLSELTKRLNTGLY